MKRNTLNTEVQIPDTLEQKPSLCTAFLPAFAAEAVISRMDCSHLTDWLINQLLCLAG